MHHCCCETRWNPGTWCHCQHHVVHVAPPLHMFNSFPYNTIQAVPRTERTVAALAFLGSNYITQQNLVVINPSPPYIAEQHSTAVLCCSNATDFGGVVTSCRESRETSSVASSGSLQQTAAGTWKASSLCTCFQRRLLPQDKLELQYTAVPGQSPVLVYNLSQYSLCHQSWNILRRADLAKATFSAHYIPLACL